MESEHSGISIADSTYTASKNNRMDTYSYDSSGNLLNDMLSHAFTYDGENRPSAGGGVTYYYDGESERIAKSSGKLYWFGTNSSPVLETDTSGNTPTEYVFFDGKRVAMRKSDGSVHYYFADQVGSADVVTNSIGAMPPEEDIEYHPYGEQQVYTDTLGQEYRFTGHEHDTETNDDYFGARYYSSGFGRFLTPDWSATPVPVPYAVLGNPQTLNLYSYVENNPITGTDPDGHACQNGTTNCPNDAAKNDQDDSKKAKDETLSRQHAKDLLDQAWGALVAGTSQIADKAKLAIDRIEVTMEGAAEKAPAAAEAGGASVGTLAAGGSLSVFFLTGRTADNDHDTIPYATKPNQEESPAAEPAPAAGGAGARKGGDVPLSDRDPKRYFTKSEKKELNENAQGVCQTCGRKTVPAQKSARGVRPSPLEGQAGHKEAWSRGGRTNVKNGKWQCRECNLREGANSQ